MSKLSVLGVGAIVKSKNKYLVVQEKSYNNSIGKELNSYGFPMGHVNQDENVMDAAIREVKEETGYLIKLIDIVGFYDIKGAFGIAFRAELNSSKQNKYKQNEIKNVSWLTREELLGKNLRPAVEEAINDFENDINLDLNIISLL